MTGRADRSLSAKDSAPRHLPNPQVLHDRLGFRLFKVKGTDSLSGSAMRSNSRALSHERRSGEQNNSSGLPLNFDDPRAKIG